MSPYIKLSKPALCAAPGCEKPYLRRGRGAFWENGRVYCVRCAKRLGQSEIDQDEQDILDQLG